MKKIKFTKSERLEIELNSKIKELEREGFKLHHSSVARGYESTEFKGLEDYDGIYGKGYILHVPTLISFVTGNRCHRIYYFIKSE